MYRLLLALGFLGFINAEIRCPFTEVEKDKGYTGMLRNGKPRKTIANGKKVQLICGTGNHNYTCKSGVLTANSLSQDRCACRDVFDLVKDQPSYRRYDNVRYYYPKNSNVEEEVLYTTYRNGTTATLHCDDGPVMNGTNVTVCVSGTWTPKPGFCPRTCFLNSLKKEGNFQYANATTGPVPRVLIKPLIPIASRRRREDEVEHGVKAKAFCTGQAPEDAQEFECYDRSWKPDPVPCP